MSWGYKDDPSGFSVRSSAPTESRYLAAGYWRDTTLVDVAREAVREDPTRVLLTEGDVRLTCSDAWIAASRLAAFFRSRGLEPGNVVSFQLPNWIESAVIALAARMAGLVINPIPPIYREAELSYILRDCGSKLIFIPSVFRKHDYQAMLTKIRADLPALRDVVVIRGTSLGQLQWGDVQAETLATDPPPTKVAPSSVMMVMYTSGTTGRPKGVLHTHYGFDYRVRAMGEVWGIGRDDVVFMPSPVTHITGAFWAFDMPWVRGCTSVLLDVWSGDQGLECIEHNRCTVSGGATPFLQQMLDISAMQPGRLRSLRLFFCGGTTVSPDLIRRATAEIPDCLFFRVYGSTEMTTTTVGIRSRAQAHLGAETDGEVIPPTEVQIVEAAGDAAVAVAEGEEGEIIARGPEQFVGYVHPEDNESAFTADGYFRMGDLGRRVHGYYLVITGRKKDIVIRAGENISPKEVEDALFNHPAVAEAAIVAMPSAATGEKCCAFIIPRPNAHIDLPEIRRFLEEAGLARQKFPEHLVLVDDLPRVPSGKVRKDVLRARARRITEEENTP
jgi:acyl-CoA synthetase (AMP-forming)/AMP-acid ligase II